MRLTFVSCILPLAFVSTISYGQQATPPSKPPSTQQNAVKGSGAQGAQTKVAQTRKTHQRVTRKRNSRSAHGAKRPEYTQNSVEVINGASTKKVVFESHKDVPASGSTKNAPAPLKVEVLNGTSTDTQYFYAGNAQAIHGSTQKRPVVIGIQSADTHVAGGNKHPVVSGITAAEPGDATSASGGGPKLATGVAPQPKRPDYQPDSH